MSNIRLFVYGTLMVPEVLFALTRTKYEPRAAVLEGYKRSGLAGRSYPGMVRDEKSRVQGLILDVSEGDFRIIDEFEGDMYTCETVYPLVDGEEYEARAYVLKAKYENLLVNSDWSVESFVRKSLSAFLRGG